MAANNYLLHQIAQGGGVGYDPDYMAKQQMQEQTLKRNALNIQQDQTLFDQGQQDRKLQTVREDLASFYMLPDDNARQQAWQSGFAQHYGATPDEDWRQSVGEFVRANPGVLGPELSQKILERHFAPKQNIGGDPSSVQEYEFFNKLPPEGQQKFMTLRRAAKTIDLGDSQAVLSPQGTISQKYDKTVPPQDQPEFKQQQAEAAARGKALGEVEEKRPALDSFKIAKNSMLESVRGTPTGGPLGATGRAGAITNYQAQRQFENRKQQLSTEIRTVFRIPGEGTLTEQEQAQYGIQLPDVLNDPSINETIMKELEARVMARMRQPLPQQPEQPQEPAQPAVRRRRYNPQTGKIE